MDENNDQLPEALRQRLHDLSPSLPGEQRAADHQLLAQAHRQIGRARVRRFAWRMATAGGLAACLLIGLFLYHAGQSPRPEASPVAMVSQADLTHATMADALRAAQSMRQSGRFSQAEVDRIAMASVSVHQEGPQ